jgi:glycosyltransferase involved in cell wall biosynthesis
VKRLVVLCPYPVGVAPSQRFKFEQYYEDWRAHGWTVDVRPFWDRTAWSTLYTPGGKIGKTIHLLRGLRRRLRDTRHALQADLVYLHLEAVPVGPPLLEGLVSGRVPLVYDIDDLVQLPHSSSANPFMGWVRSREKPLRLMRSADHVVVCTSYMRDLAKMENAHVTNISSTIDTERYLPVIPRDRRDGVVVGWSGSHSTAPYLHLLDEVFLELQRTEGIRVRVIGDGEFQAPGLEIEAQEWCGETEVSDLAEIDVGVYPLPDEEWVLGKSGLKLLQYMGMGLPAVAERVGTNMEIVEHGVNGFLARGPEEWHRAILSLVRDPELRRRVGRAGRETVEARYSLRVNAPAYREALAAALEAHHGCTTLPGESRSD